MTIGRVVQGLPAPPHAAAHGVGRGCCERRQQHQRRKADRDERPLDEVFENRRQQQALIEYQPGQEMHEHVEERKQAEHSAKARQPVPAREPAQRRDGERDHDEAQRPVAEAVLNLLDRVRAESSRQLEVRR